MMKWWNYFGVPTFPECTLSPLPQTLQNGQRNRAEVCKNYYQNNKEMLAQRFLFRFVVSECEIPGCGPAAGLFRRDVI